MRFFAVAAAVLLAGPAVARASAPAIPIPTRLTAKELRALCRQRRNEGACLAYVLGAVDAFVATSVANSGGTDLCFPAKTTNREIAGVAVAYLHAHPEAEDRNAAIVVLQGVRAAFSCR